MPIILWCGRFSREDGGASGFAPLVSELRDAGVDVIAYDTARSGLVSAELDGDPVVVVAQDGEVAEIRAADDARPLVVVCSDPPEALANITVAGQSRFVAYVADRQDDEAAEWAENLVAVDEVWVGSDAVRNAVVAGGVPGFLVTTQTVPGVVARISAYEPHEYRAVEPAVARHQRAAALWVRQKIPTRVSIATHGVNSRLAEFGRIPARNVVAKQRSYTAASAARRSHHVSASALQRHQALEQLSTVMKTSMRHPIAKLKSMVRLNTMARSIEPGDPRLGPAIQEYWESEKRLFEPTADFMDRRKAIWDRFGAVPLSVDDAARLGELRDRHRGRRVFVIGNGPSLNKLELERLAAEFTFGVNRIGLLFDRISWRPDYWTVTDWRVGPQLRESYSELDEITKLVPNRFRGVLPDDEATYWYHSRRVGPYLADQFETDITQGIPSRATVLVTAIQQAFYLGFREIYLIGVDASYSIPPTVIQSGPDRFGTGIKLNLESTRDDDVNHFDPRYFGTGAKWHDPNVNEMLRMFRVMRKGVEFHGGTIKNATAGGNLEVFERAEFDSLF